MEPMIRRMLVTALAMGVLSAGVGAAPPDGGRAGDRGGPGSGSRGGTPTTAKVASVEFIGMAAPATPDQKTDIYTGAKVRVVYRNGKSTVHDLQYHELMGTTDRVNGALVGGLFNHLDQPLLDINGQQLASDAPDANSLMTIPGLQAADPAKKRALALVTQYEYRELPPAGSTGSFWSKLPATMSLTLIDQDKQTGRLQPIDYRTIHFGDAAGLNGLWIPCAGSLSPWNTHLGSEEYEPDAKVRQLGPTWRASDSDDTTDISSFSGYFFGDPARANAYHYGLVPEVSVDRTGWTSVQMHYAMGRIARELVEVMPDARTAYMGDDGKNTGLFMFIADQPGDLSSGTLYAARWHQVSTANGGAATLGWIRLGRATNADIEAMVESGIRFTDIFDVSLTDPGDPTYKKVATYTGTEWLRLKPGKAQAAAFLETRRYAAYLGATTEFSKMEGVSHDPRGGPGFNARAFVVISRVENGMRTQASAPADDIQVAENLGGAIYELTLTGGQVDQANGSIDSEYVATTMASIAELSGGWFGRDAAGKEIRDAEGNRCHQDKVCGGDNLKFSPVARTLFIGEDTARRNNNYVWAFNLDTRKLSRILSVPRAAEATGLQVVENANGFAYILSNFQHPGEAEQYSPSTNPEDAVLFPLLRQKWHDLKRSAVGYIGTTEGALPAFK
jgi:secreted PhoX family phosphatase